MSDQNASQEKTFSPPEPSPLQPVVAPVVPSVKKPRKLRLSQEAFVRAIADPSKPSFCNGRAAHLASHPRCTSKQGAAVEASKSLKKPNVQDAIVKAFEAVHYDKEGLAHELSKNLQACWDAKRFDLHQSAIERYAKLTGEWKEKSEVTTVAEQTQNFIRRAVAERVLSQRQEN